MRLHSKTLSVYLASAAEARALKLLVQNGSQDEDAPTRSIRAKLWNALPSLPDLEVLVRHEQTSDYNPELDSDL